MINRGLLTIIGFGFIAAILILAADYRRRFLVIEGPLQLGQGEVVEEDRLFLKVMESYRESVNSRLNR
jgi:hypothetical protein